MGPQGAATPKDATPIATTEVGAPIVLTGATDMGPEVLAADSQRRTDDATTDTKATTESVRTIRLGDWNSAKEIISRTEHRSGSTDLADEIWRDCRPDLCQ